MTLYRFLLIISLVAGTASNGIGQTNLKKAEKEFYRQNYRGALDLFIQFEDQLSEDPDLSYKTGYCKYVLGDYTGALHSFTQAIHLDSTMSAYYRLRGLCKKSLRDLDGAASDLKRALANENAYDTRYALAEVLFLKGDYGSCTVYATGAIKLNPTDSAHALCGACYLKTGDTKNALQYYDAAIAKGTHNKDVLHGRGMVKLAMDDAPGAYTDFTRAIDIDNSAVEVYHNRAQSLRLMNRYEDALKDLTRAIELGRTDANTYFARGTIREDIKDYTGAVADYTVAIEKDRAHASYYFSRALAKTKRNDHRGAIEDYKTYLNFTPGDVTTMLNLSEVYFMNGDFANAEAIALDAQVYAKRVKYRAVNLLLICAAGKMLGKDIKEYEAKLDKTLQEDFTVSWSFEDMEDYLRTASLSPEKRQYVGRLIERILEKREK
jgi:tetratricopeptide (TPR) repeat protein